MAKKKTTEITEKKPRAVKTEPLVKAIDAFKEINILREQIGGCKTFDDLIEVKKRVMNNLKTLKDTVEKKNAIMFLNEIKEENNHESNFKSLLMATGLHNMCIGNLNNYSLKK